MEASVLSELAKATFAGFNQSVRLSGLDTAVTLHQAALHLHPGVHPKWLDSLGSMAVSLYTRFRCTDDMSSLNEAIAFLRGAVGTYENLNVHHSGLPGHLSAMLAIRFDKTDSLLDLAKAVTRHHDIYPFTGTNGGEKVSQLLLLAANYFQWFKHTGQITDLEMAISLFRECRALQPPPHLLPTSYNLAMALLKRFQQSGKHEDLDEAIFSH